MSPVAQRGPIVDFREPLEVPVPQWNSDEPLPPLAMLAATSPGSKEMLEDARRMGYANPPARADLELSNLRGEFLASERESERGREG
jgi:hypothetical protein